MKIYHDSSDESQHDVCIGQVLVPLDQMDLSTKCVLCKGISADDKQVSNMVSGAHCCHMGRAMKHSVPERVKSSFVIFDIQTL